MRRSWKPYNPARLVELACQQRPDLDWLPDALSLCTHQLEESRAYYYFLDPGDKPNSPGSPWQFEMNVTLEDKKEGTIVLDIVSGRRVGGMEFLKRL